MRKLRDKSEVNVKGLAVQYSLIQATYWIMMCMLGGGYGTVFLLDKGFTSTQAGIAIAFGNTLGVILQPVLAAIADSNKKITMHKIMASLAGIIVVGYWAVIFVQSPILALGILYVLTFALIATMQSFTNALSLYYINRGVALNYGLPRGMGSVSYAVISVVVGELLKKTGTNVLPAIGIAAAILFGIVLLSMPILADGNSDEANAKQEKQKSFFEFLKRYPIFMLFILGTTITFVFHGMCNTYLITLMESVGGNATQMGTSQSIAAIVELPIMALSGLLMKKFKTKYLISFAAVMFVVKAFAYFFAASVLGMYLAQGFQMFSYAIFIPVSVFFVNEQMDDNDMVKGQALVGSAIYIGGIVSSLMGGTIVDQMGVRALEIAQIIFAVIGGIILVASALLEHPSHGEDH